MYGSVAFSQWGPNWFPCLVLDPSSLPQRHVARMEWDKANQKKGKGKILHLVYWYGAEVDEMYSVVSSLRLHEKMAPSVSERTLAKLQPLCRKEIEDDLLLEPRERWPRKVAGYGPSQGAPSVSLASSVTVQAHERVVATTKTFSGGDFGPEKRIRLCDNALETSPSGDKRFKIPVPSSYGQAFFYPNFVNLEDCNELWGSVTKKTTTGTGIFRQYRGRSGKESRVHVLLDCSSRDTLGNAYYGYHGVHMVSSKNIDDIGGKEKILRTVGNRAAVATGIGLLVMLFNLGVELVFTRYLKDNLPPHADDNNQETCIFTFIAHAGEIVRPVVFGPKNAEGRSKSKKNEYQEGDVVVSIFPATGDAYSMDGELQKHYVHSLPAVCDKKLPEKAKKSQRLSFVFRQGSEPTRKSDRLDNGTEVSDLNPPDCSDEVCYPFGPMPDVLEEGCLYTREWLSEKNAFKNAQGGISGNKQHGCCAIVVAHQTVGDSFEELDYYATTLQRGGALCTTFGVRHQPVRVFRSTELKGPYAALRGPGNSPSVQMFRYDGLYNVEQCFLVDGDSETTEFRPGKSQSYKFRLRRAGHGEGGNKRPTALHLGHCFEQRSISREGFEHGGGRTVDASLEVTIPTSFTGEPSRGKRRRTEGERE